MIVEYFEVCSLITLSLIVTEAADGYTAAGDFQTTVCKWHNSRCSVQDASGFVSSEGNTTSKWPNGPYALFTPNEGCPESIEKGWGRGYISFTWEQTHTLMSVNDCDGNNTHNQTLNEKEMKGTSASEFDDCWRKLTPDLWPDIQSGLLGPFSRHAIRLNFCFKTDENADIDDDTLWPAGSYNIFGDKTGCPSGFRSSEKLIKFPAISTWTADGFLPDFTVEKARAYNSVTLTLKVCERQVVADEINNQSYFSADSFIFMKNDQNFSCPQLLDTVVTAESIKLQEDITNNRKFIDLFTICYYRSSKWSIEFDTYLFEPRDSLPYFTDQAFVILNPTLIYGNKTTSSRHSLFHELGTHTWPSGYERITMPWLLIDLGRNSIVVGLQFAEFFLTEIDSKEYKGSLNTTKYGYKCQRWDVQYPHSHQMTGDLLLDETLSDAENYCRNIEDDKIWCYTQDPDVRYDYCADKVYTFQQEDRPFSKCFISDERWRIDQFGAISCSSRVSYKPGTLYFKFLKEQEGRYLKLVGYAGTESSMFNSLVQNVEILTSAKSLNTDYQRMCNSDIGMGDESVYDSQITASSWLSQSPPTSGRPFFSGWCSVVSDKNPFITVDMMKDTKIEGITIFNWERTEEEVTYGTYKKSYIPVGSKIVMVSYCTDPNMGQSSTCTNKTFSVDTFLPINHPQTVVHRPVHARYITLYIIEAMNDNAKCLRFELHGCKQYGDSIINFPELLAVSWMMSNASLAGTELITVNNLQALKNTSVLSSIDYPMHYSGGMSYTWIINVQEGSFIQLIISNTSFNDYGEDESEQCSDTLKSLPCAYKETSIYINRRFNGLVSLIESDLSYMSLTFTTCRPTSKIKSIGYGFKAIVKTQAIPTCFAPHDTEDNKEQSHCMRPMMYITSISRLNFPDSDVPEEWIIHVKRFSFLLKIVYFNVRCDTGSLLNISDRFSGRKTFCNLRMVPPEMYSNSDTLRIRFEKGRNGISASSHRESAREGFKAVYRTVEKSMAHLIEIQNTYSQVLRKLMQLETNWDPEWKNATLLAYEACSKKFGKCYSIYSGAVTSWNDAGAECWIRKSRLVSIHTDEEQELIKYILRNFRYFDMVTYTLETAFSSDKVDPNYFTHIGLSRVTSDSQTEKHLWEDSSPVTFSAWKVNEPSSDGACTRMNFHLFNTNNTWESESCEKGLASYFICELDLTPEKLQMSKTSSTSSYLATLNVTLSGIPCQRWDLQNPHIHVYNTDEMFPGKSVSDAKNFCHYFDSSGYLWCYTEDPDVRWEKCWIKETTHIGPHMYTGRLSTTASGRTCQQWKSQTPHQHSFARNSNFPDATLDEAANYCRDPSDDGILWCFTTDPYRRWDTCNFIETALDRCNSTHSLYTGRQNRTQSGKACQPWGSQSPHNHEPFFDSQFPDGSVAEASNYCRDPYNEGYLWCFTMDPATKSEPCVFEYKYQLSDERDRGSYPNETFQCNNGESIPWQNWCDGFANCLDLTDEKNCTEQVHALMKDRPVPTAISPLNEMYSLFQCESKEWISMLARCDGVIDCIDATDELNCSGSLGAPGCLKDEYTCDDGGCIHISQMCDFIADCSDASDENCDFPLCSSAEYRCKNQQCIPKINRCDAYKHCLDGSDETRCDACRENVFHCDLVRCIPRRLVCDKYADCRDGSDEMSCDQPIYNSCEEWWNAGYRKSGIYKLNDTEAECKFDDVHKDGIIYTLFHNFEITSRYGVELIHFTEREFSQPCTTNSFFQNKKYTCFQKITQSCVPAHKAAADYEDPYHEDAYRHCDCLIMTVNPCRYNANVSNVYYCESDEMVSDTNKLLFEYVEWNNFRYIMLKVDTLPKGVEVTFGPAVCKHEGVLHARDVSCEGATVFPASVRCIYDTDPAGFILGCRSGQHLQGCETFQCPKNTVKCPGSFCLPLKFICDGKKQCPGGQDEQDCGCKDDDREVLIMYEDGNSIEDNERLRRIATQFYTVNSIVRELRYRSRTLPSKLDFDHRMLDVSDTEISPYAAINRQFVCNYSVLASDFINSVAFSKTNARGVLFLQKRNYTDILPKMMFGNLKSRPEFLIYRVMQDIHGVTSEPESFPFVQNVGFKRWSTLATIGAMFFPELCKEAAKVLCPYEYKCATSKTCIPMEQVCDGHAQCVNGDDERSCDYSCPANCSCSQYTTDCSFADIDHTTLSSLHRKSRLLDLSGNPGLQKSLVISEWKFAHLISLNLSKCDIDEIKKNVFQTLGNLRILDLSFNKFTKIPGHAFIGLRKLKHLNLFGNKEIYSLESFSLNGLLSIRSLDIMGGNFRRLSSHAFAGLDLNQLNLSDNKIMELEDDVFSGLKIKVMDIKRNEIKSFNKGVFRGVFGITSLYTPAFKYCCVRPNYLAETNCYPEKDEFSSCDDLLRLSALQTMLWLIGILALFGNILAVVYRLVYDRDRLRFGYGLFVTNLAVADFLMGIYLIIIAIADAMFRKRYIFMDDYWRNSAWCTIAGFLSTVSSEASVFFLCLITLDRLIVIKYPFGQVRFDSKKSGIACLMSWIVAVSVGLIPILYHGYFHGRFYSKSGVCIALPLTRDRPPGWLYSIIIFVGLNFVTFCLIAIGQIVIYFEIKKATSRIRRSSNIWDKSGSGRRKELTIARNLLFVVATDFLCWFPVGCMGMMSVSGHVIPGDVYAWTAVFILPVNSALNPVLYTLTAILGKKKREPQMDKRVSSVGTPRSGTCKNTIPFNGLFRYFITPKDNFGQTFESLDDLPKDGMTIRTSDVVKISLQLMRSVRLLHRHSMVMEKLNGNTVYTNVEYGKIVGDIQLRHEPTMCYSTEKKADDIYQFGQVLRGLLVKRNKQTLA